jgi:trimeric autotransporter adhesin
LRSTQQGQRQQKQIAIIIMKIKYYILGLLAGAMATANVGTSAPVVVGGDELNIGQTHQLRTNGVCCISYNTIAGGQSNTNYAEARGAIGGGANNWISTNRSIYADSSIIAGGLGNYLDASYSAILGGAYNRIEHTNGLPDTDGSQRNVTSTGVIGGGSGNILYGFHSVIGGGLSNTVDAWVNFSVIAGGALNTIDYGSGYSLISGGTENIIEEGAWWASINGGLANGITGSANGSLTNGFFGHFGWIGGGRQNWINGFGLYGSIGGGWGNIVDDFTGTIGGGAGNDVLGFAGTIAGGHHSMIETNAQFAAIGGGYGNEIETNATHGFIAGGRENRIRVNAEYSAVGGGSANEVGTGASYATVPGGGLNEANGNGSFAAGWRAKADHDGAFVWGDWSGADVASTAANQFVVRASGGIWLGTNSSVSIGANRFIDTASGGNLTHGGQWQNNSDRNAKENFKPVDGKKVLEQLAALPVTTWNYKVEGKQIEHIGPVAQDFQATFKYGGDEKSISTSDASGVAFAAIQGLYEMLREKDTRLHEQDTQLKELQKELKAVKDQLTK